MKTKLSLTALLLFLTTTIFAQGIVFSSGDFDFEVYGMDSTEVQLKAFDDILKGDIVIPESVSYKGKTYAVTRIEDWGNNPKVVSIRIPKTVRTISSLSSLSNLQNVYVDEGNPTYQSIDGVLISSSDMSLNEYPQGRAGECVVPEGVKRINTNFRSGITKLTIPSSVTYITSSIGYYIEAFDVAEGNAQFSSVNGMLCSKDGKTLIAYPATSSSMVVIPENIDSIGTYAFQQNRSIILTSALPLSIGHYSWYEYNTRITGIYVKSEHLTTYQSNAKTSKYNLYGYDIIADSILYAKTDEGKAALIGSYSQSPSISIPQTITDGTNTYTITSIGRKAFYQNSALQEVIFPETLEAIGDSAFYYTNLREITLPATLTKLGKYAFYCRNLNIIYAKCAPVDIREGCFYSYYSTYLYVPYEYEELYKTAMGWGNFTITANDLVYDNFVFKKVTDETLMVIKYIGNQTDITMPDEVAIDNKMYKITAIGESVFYSKKLTNIKLPKYLEVIRERAFRNNSLTSIEFPASLKTIGDYAFYSNSLQTINLPASLESIGYYAFSSNSNLRTIIVNGEVPCELEYNAFGYSSNIMIMVKPSSAAEAYKTDLDWSNYSSYIYGADAIIDELAYLKHDNQTVTLVSCLKAFSDNEYEKMTIPKSVNIDNADYQVTTIGEGAFYSVNNLNELIIPETIDSIGSRAFDSNLIIRCESQIPPKTNSNTFYYYYSYYYPKRVIVPITALEVYKTAENWSQLGNRIIAYDIQVDGVAYLKTDESHVSVCAIISTTNNTLEIPEKITSDNNEYTVSSISSGAFSNTSGKLLILPQTIENIASSINFGNFTYTYLKCTTPPRLESTYWSSKVIYVPQSSLALYQNDKRWVPDDYYKSYIQGTDGFVYNDSTIYELKNTTGTADLCLWMKAKSETIEIPNSIICDGKSYSITVLRSSSFSNYYDVEKFHFPASIADIGDNALPPSYGMTIISEALTPPTIGYHDSFYTQNQSLFVKSAAYEKYVLADGWKDYGKIEAFDGGDDQFYYIKVENGKAAVSGIKAVSVTEAEIPENIVIDGESMTVTQIGRKVFMNNTNLQKVILPNTIEAIGDSAFFGSRLQQITIPAYVRSIGERAFAVNTQNSTYSYLSKIQTRAGNEFFMSRNGTLLLTKDGKTLLQAAEYGGEVSSIWDYDDDGNYGRQEINPLDGIVRVANGAFDGCQISSIKIPATLTTADAPMLMYMPYLLEILVDASNEKLCSVDGILFSKDTTTVLYFPNYKNNSYYYDNSRIYELPGKVQNVARFAFYNSQFESLTLSPNLKTIADSAFYNTTYYYSSSQQINTLILTNKVIATASETAFNDGIYQNTILYIPTGSQNLYLITSPWSNFQNIISGELADEEFQILKAFYAEMDNGRGWSRKWNIGETAEQTRLTTGFRMIDGHIYSINLSNNYLNGPLSDKLFKLPKLEVLNLSNNQLACPIDSVLNEKNIDNSVLRELNISDNKFTGNIGAAGKTLKGLTTLNASYNKLSQVTPMLPTSISALSLYSQQIDTVDFKALYTANKEYVESGQPNLLFYDHENQNFTLDRTFTLEDNNYSYWQMLLSSIDGELTASEYSQYYRLYNRPNGEKLRLYSSNDNHQAYIRMLFDPGDVNFDTKVSVNDLQLTVNYAVSETAEQLFNFKTADIQSDDWVNVQDVVSLVNILLDQEIHTNSASAVSRRAANAEEAEAQLFWRGNQLVLKSERDVAALDIAIRNTQNVKWLLNDRDYDYSVSRKDGYIRIIHYSMSGKEIKAGETIIAEAVGSNMSVMKADLVGKDGSDITTIWTGNATGIEERSGIASGVRIVADASGLIIKNDKAMPKTQWAIYSIGGKLLGKGIADLSPGINTLWCNLAGENQIVMHLSNNDIHISKKISITK